ncbi:RelB/DinJ family addiction module antitoxin [Dorea sp. 5-2]|nr:RelB/DinJ family addiction module antitoxin [Dorea sp. 5-2]
MANTLVQFRTEETARIKAVSICEKLGIDLPTYLRMCMSRLIQENGVPFSMKIDEISENKGIQAMKAASRIAVENGISDMTLDEINAEITEARK